MKRPVPDNSSLITQATATTLNKKLFSPGAHRGLYNDFERFIKEESKCSKDVQKLLFAYNKIVLHMTMISFAQNNEIPEEVVNTVSDQLNKLFQCSFSAGLLYGRARMDQSFIELVSKEIEEQQFNDIDAMISEATEERPLDSAIESDNDDDDDDELEA